MLAGGVFALVAAVRLVSPVRAPRSPPAAAALLLARRLRVERPARRAARRWSRRRRRSATGPARSAATNARVHQILQPNTDPHEYEPRPADVEATAGAKLVLESGDDLDGWMGKVVSEAGGKPTVVDLGERAGRAGESGPRLATTRTGGTTRATRSPRSARSGDALVRADPDARAGVPAERRRLRREAARARPRHRRVLRAGAARRSASSSPTTTRSATSRARYGIQVVGAVIPSQTTQAQPSAGETAKLIALIRREHVKAVFPESSINPKLAQAIARETGASSRLHALRRHARPPVAGRRTSRWSARTPTRWCAASPAAGCGCTSRERAAPRRRRPRRRLRRAARARGRLVRRSSPGERIGVLGPNGGGKSTLFRALLGELEPVVGRVRRARAGSATCRRPSARGSTTRSARSTSR